MAVTKRPSRPPEPASRIAEIRDQMMVRLEFIWTLILDTGVVMTAIACRAAVLWLFKKLAPASSEAETHTWAIRALEFIADVAIVFSAALFVAFDLLKRLVNGWRALRRHMQS